MKSLRSLAILAIGAFLLSAVYALSAGRSEKSISIEDDSDFAQSARHTISGEKSEFSFHNDEMAIKAKWRGDFTLDDSGMSLEGLDDKLEILIKEEGRKESAYFKPNDGEIETTYFIDGEEQPEGEESNEGAANLFLRFLRASGFKADERVEILFDEGGSEAVFTEMDKLEQGHAMRHYAIAFAEHENLEPAEIIQLTEKISTIEGDHDISRALEALLENQEIDSQTAPALIEAADAIEGDHELRRLVQAFAERDLTNDEVDMLLGLYERIESSHDLRVAAYALLENETINADQAARILSSAADHITSDHDLRLVLTSAAPGFASSDTASEAWLSGFVKLQSDHDRRRALEAVVEEADDMKASDWIALIEAASRIESDHDLRLALIMIAEEADDTEAIRETYLETAALIDSESDREIALSVLDGD